MISDDPFAHLIPEAQAFLAELAQNNTRDWFIPQRPRYDAELKAPALLLQDQIAATLGGKTGRVLTPKLFRPHRDVRFSKDKTPYTQHLHMIWTVSGKGRQATALFFGIAPGYVRVGGGVMAFEKPVLLDWRADLDGPFGADMQAVLEVAAGQGLRPDAPDLKRVPPPYAADHPRRVVAAKGAGDLDRSATRRPWPTAGCAGAGLCADQTGARLSGPGVVICLYLRLSGCSAVPRIWLECRIT